jgi:DNA-binding transcriptional regulator GbsR (MarR family)
MFGIFMSPSDKIKRETIQDFGHAYQTFGLSKLMGRVVALLIFSPEPLSLDEISEQLEMSKGPISQITRRLNDHNLIQKIWKPGSRKDFYQIQPAIFSNAFRNNLDLIKNNSEIARKLKDRVEQNEDISLQVLHKRLSEMQHFYELMETHFQNFLNEWEKERKQLYEE